jgi:tetratricopeptide (TPR) repeat protein
LCNGDSLTIMPPTPPSSSDNVSALLKKALAFHEEGRLDDARAYYNEVLVSEPQNIDALHLLGVLKHQQGEHQEAINLISRSLAMHPTHPEALNNLGNALLALQRPEEALASYDKAIALKPSYAEAHLNRGNALHELGQFGAALQSYDTALTLDPTSALAYNNRGDLIRDLGKPEEALAHFDKAIELNPYFDAAYVNRGNVLRSLRRFSGALADFDHAIALNPSSAEAHNNRGNILREIGEYQLATQSFSKALALNPDFAEAHMNQAFSYLASGALMHGWKQYEWRWKLASSDRFKRDFKQPRWNGKEKLRGKSIFIHSEQGFGDTINFCRYIKMLNDLGAHVIFEVQRPLVSLLRTLAGAGDVIAEGSPLPHFDYYCPLMSLPGLLKTTLTTIPAPGQYIFSNAEHVARWRARLPDSSLPRIGICWSGSPTQENDRNRSIPLSQFVEALPPGALYVSLQKEVREHDLAALASRPDIIHFGDQIDDFSDTAALIELVDEVVSVDSSVAHLAGAMNQPLCLLLAFNADWRWLSRRRDSPWYHSATLYRQQQIGDWADVLSDARGYIASMIGSHTSS